MEAQAPPRPRVSRETRLLFATVIAAVIALWVLARFRFPEQPPSVNPVAPVLTQLAPTPAFGDLAAVVSDVQGRVLSPFLTLSLSSDSADHPQDRAAYRVRDDVAVALLDVPRGPLPRPQGGGVSLLNVDPATGLATIKVPSLRSADLTEWTPARLESPRYLLCTTTVPGALSLRPVFVSTLRTDNSATWGATVWTAPRHTDLVPGSFAFTTTGSFAGLVVRQDDGAAILPASALADAVDRVLKQRQGSRGWIGLSIQSLTPALAAATGSIRGVIVTWVDPDGPAAGSLQPGDVLESMDDPQGEITEETFAARTARLLAGDAITLHVRRGELAQPVRLTAIERPPAAPLLGLTLRGVRAGAEVLRVEHDSAADVAGILPGDVITLAGTTQAPSPVLVRRAFAAGTGRPLLLGITRGSSHFVVAVGTR
ncbi:MAG: hypothetical protein ACM36C_07750 [Acidobacteriota bacterium]